MPQPIHIQDTRLARYMRLFRHVFSLPQWKYFVTVLLGLLHCDERRTLSALLRHIVVKVTIEEVTTFEPPPDTHTHLLIDSWYMAKRIWRAARWRGWDVTGGNTVRIQSTPGRGRPDLRGSGLTFRSSHSHSIEHDTPVTAFRRGRKGFGAVLEGSRRMARAIRVDGSSPTVYRRVVQVQRPPKAAMTCRSKG